MYWVICGKVGGHVGGRGVLAGAVSLGFERYMGEVVTLRRKAGIRLLLLSAL